ncbi:arylamine N-acetyltransferase 1 [Cadophora sp. MPI-SDFR-AT-0126]|nr:arylamine N-acetyltransferase 1 [Leotiomycetes sp. MPI-SDFR-AT-0126]
MASAYTPSQLSLYERHISLPLQFHHTSTRPPLLNLSYLSALHTHQISTCPYENLQLHYSATHTVSLDPQVLFKKIVTDKRGRGGYCMENAILFHHVLRGLGWRVYLAGVRIRLREGGVPRGDYVGWVHIVNIVTLPTGEKYMLDVSFGGDGPTIPLPLTSGLTHLNLGTQEIRLLHSTIPQQLDQTKPLWIYQYRNAPTQEWNSFYAFPETEFTEADFRVMNHWTSTSMESTNWQTRRVLVIRFLRGLVEGEGEERGKEGIVGKVMLVDGEIKRNDGGRTRSVKVCRSEEERIEALKVDFGIELTDEEREGIKGRNVELLA